MTEEDAWKWFVRVRWADTQGNTLLPGMRIRDTRRHPASALALPFLQMWHRVQRDPWDHPGEPEAQPP